MSTRSAIEWTEVTWNPVTGCTKISPGCKFCYAERLAKRLQAMGVAKYRDGFSVAVHESTLEEPLKWRRPRLVFVNSMSDLFHESVPSAFIEAVFEVMNRASRHTFQVLTKRPSRVVELNRRLRWTPNIWLGTSIDRRNSGSNGWRYSRRPVPEPSFYHSNPCWDRCRTFRWKVSTG